MPQRLPLLTDALDAELYQHAARLRALPLRGLTDLGSAERGFLLFEGGGLAIDASRQQLDRPALAALLAAAGASGLERAIADLFAGARVNNTEGRAALHTALRSLSREPLSVDGADVRAAVAAERERCRQFVASVTSGVRRGATGERLVDVVNIGIGGSDLGPVMACEALHGYRDARVRIHFVSNVDGTQLADLFAELQPARTLFIICSKTFSTQETLANARLARAFIADKLGPAAIPRHFAAVSVNQAAMDEFGVGADARFAMWDWVGGRYSIWSSVGLAVELAVGTSNFEQFLAGGAAMDEHFLTAPLAANLPVMHALLGIWNRNFMERDTLCVLPYDQRLHRFPAYLQQLIMESLGKSVRRDGTPATCATGPIVWGECGSNGQHSFFQLLHQGTVSAALDFVLCGRSSVGFAPSHELTVANCLAQADAFARGYTADEVRADLARQDLPAERIAALAAHKVHPGNTPSSIVLMDALTPDALGRLVALYEHSVYVAGVLWDVNPFDQWGVELGKRLANDILASWREPSRLTTGVSVDIVSAWFAARSART